jgi:hypothetical protein
VPFGDSCGAALPHFFSKYPASLNLQTRPDLFVKTGKENRAFLLSQIRIDH